MSIQNRLTHIGLSHETQQKLFSVVDNVAHQIILMFILDYTKFVIT